MSQLFDTIKSWVVIKASITYPHKKYWSASVTVCGMDVSGIGSTIEKAYNDLTCNLMLNKEHKNYIITNQQKKKQVMADVFQKFIVEGGSLIIAKCTFHKQLVTDKEKVKGGGMWKWDQENKIFTLYGDSHDFGYANAEDIKKCIEARNIFLSYAGGRNVSDHTFYLNTGVETIKLN